MLPFIQSGIRIKASVWKPLSEPIFPIGCFSFVMVCLTSTTGVFIHYFVPKMRELYPWGLFKAPFLRNSEWKRFEATVKSGKVLWFEKIVVFISTLEAGFQNDVTNSTSDWLSTYEIIAIVCLLKSCVFAGTVTQLSNKQLIAVIELV